MTNTCTCCGESFESDLPQKIGEEMCNECYKAVFVDPEIDNTPLEFDPTIYGMDKSDFKFEDLREMSEGG